MSMATSLPARLTQRVRPTARGSAWTAPSWQDRRTRSCGGCGALAPAGPGRTRRERRVTRASASAPTSSSSGKERKGETEQDWVVWKFGGTCVAGPDRLKQVADLVLSHVEQKGLKLAVVLSAMGSSPAHPVKVTDQLIKAVSRAEARDELGFVKALEQLELTHRDAAQQLLGGDGERYEAYVSSLKGDMHDLRAMLKAISIAGVSSKEFADFVVGHGELWNAKLFSAYLACRGRTSSAVLDARDVLVVEETSEQDTVEVDYIASQANLDEWIETTCASQMCTQPADSPAPPMPSPVVVTGFIAKNKEGVATTLRRNGSDYTGTIMAALLSASGITIWTDVDGVYSADPRKVPEAEPLEHLSYQEAWEMSYFGANVLHPRSTLPAMRNGIPIRIKNFFNLEAEGTMINASLDLFRKSLDENYVPPEEGEDTQPSREGGWKRVVKGFATIDDCSLINIEGTGMVGVPGTASRIFTCMRDANINVIIISQGSSEHSVCFGVRGSDARMACQVLREEFKDLIQSGFIDNVFSVDNCTILAAVGSKLLDAVGASSQLFRALAQCGVSIRATAQGCSEHNISVVIDSADAAKALRAVHSGFYLSDTPLAIGLVGPGLVGKALLTQFAEQLATLKEKSHIDAQVHAICTSKRVLLSEGPVDLERWEEALENEGVMGSGEGGRVDLQEFAAHMKSLSIPNAVIIDCTASDHVASHYLGWMEEGVHVVTPNKRLNSGPLEMYQRVCSLQQQSYVHYFYEATVGAGLPIIATAKHLRDTGDKIKRIEGIFSGTLSYIFNNFKEGSKFSDIVQVAKDSGFTEPDPRDDLSGMDVARKVTTLARECGLRIELEDVPVQSLVPEELEKLASADEFMAALPGYDEQMAQQQQEAAARGEVLRFVGVVDVEEGKGSVELKAYPVDHPFAQMEGSDNIVLFKTSRYDPQPLVVRGPGAGAEVTAGGVFSDLLRLCAHLGAPS